VTVYAVSLVALFGVSTLYHRVNWRSRSAWRWMRRLDHSMIFMLIAGTYTPLAMPALHGPLATATPVAAAGRWLASCSTLCGSTRRRGRSPSLTSRRAGSR